MITTIAVVSSIVTVPVGESAYGLIEKDEAAVVSTTARESTENDEVETGVEAVVRSYFNDIPVMVSVARCESTFRHTLADGSVLRGKVDNADTGVMQINRRYHGQRAQALGLDLNDLHDNLAYARVLYEEQGTKPWNASAPCWRKEVASRS